MTSTDPSAIEELVGRVRNWQREMERSSDQLRGIAPSGSELEAAADGSGAVAETLEDAAEALTALSAERDEAIVKVAEWIAAGWQERADAAEAELTGAQATIADHLAAELEWGRVSEYQQGKIARLSDSLCAADAFAIGPNGRGGSRITLDFEDVKSAYDSFTTLSDEYNARSALQGDSQP